jgi:hypothetical protein
MRPQRPRLYAQTGAFNLSLIWIVLTTCVFLAAGRGTVLKGSYYDCEQDIVYVVSMSDHVRGQ